LCAVDLYRNDVRLEEQNDVFAIGDPGSAETHTHASAEWLGIQEPFRQWFRN
jgi:hypothetical protein